MYDIIGDIHGHANALIMLLQKMGYEQTDGVWYHANRKAIFVGDYIDRGPAIKDTLQIVKDMVDYGSAIALMGNHEYNALAYHYQLPDGTFLRKHNDKHTKQHEKTLTQFENHESEWMKYLEWFYTLPLYLETDGIRVVHACWDDDHIEWLRANGHENMSRELLLAAHKKDSKEFEILEDILKGKEIDIPEEYVWLDKDENPRNKNRIKWWEMPGKETTYEAFLFNCPDALRYQKIENAINFKVYPKNAPPVFIGHYWLDDLSPFIQSNNVVCLDYSIAKGGSLVAYRWGGENEINNQHFVQVGQNDLESLVV